MSNKIIFLDIDGVLNSKRFEINRDAMGQCYIPYYSEIDVQNIIQLNKLITELGASIVIHSSWRAEFSLKEFKEFLSDFGVNPDKVIGLTSDSVDKEESILEYIRENNITEFLILEDEIICPIESKIHSHLYKVSPMGLDSPDVSNLIKMANEGLMLYKTIVK